MAVILFIAYAAIYLCYLDAEEKYMETALKSTISWCFLIFFQTEILSLFQCVNKWSIFAVWMLISIVAFGNVIYRKKFLLLKPLCVHVISTLAHNKFFVLIFGSTLALSIWTVPYNWDSMTYHISRIAHWGQNQSIAHYSTNILRQISSPVLHEIVGLHVYLLCEKKDIFLNLIQCMAFMTNAWILYKISAKLGCNRIFCKTGLLLFCSMPIAFGEALTTQNDHFAGMWLLIFIYYLLDFLPDSTKLEWNKNTVINCVSMAACVGFGYISKPSVCIGMSAAVIILFFVCISRKDSLWTIMKLAGIAIPVMLLIIMPEFLKNIATFGTALHSNTGARQLIGTLKPNYLFVNGMKNFAFNIPSIYIPQSSRWITTIIYRISALLRVDINDPAISEDGRQFSLGDAADLGHDTAISSILTIVSVLCFCWCLYQWKRESPLQRRYTCISSALFLLICVFVRWEPFVSRYMLPYLALLCPMAAVQLQDFSRNAKRKTGRLSCVPVIYCLCIAQLSLLFFYHLEIARKQGTEKPEGYFYNYGREAAYINVCNLVKEGNYSKIGLMLGENTYEYPIWYMLGNEVERIEHIMVYNESNKYEDETFIPDCILVSTTQEDILALSYGLYRKETDEGTINLYVRYN